MANPNDPLNLGGLAPQAPPYYLAAPDAPYDPSTDPGYSDSNRATPPAGYADRNQYWAGVRQIEQERQQEEAKKLQEAYQAQQNANFQREVERQRWQQARDAALRQAGPAATNLFNTAHRYNTLGQLANAVDAEAASKSPQQRGQEAEVAYAAQTPGYTPETGSMGNFGFEDIPANIGRTLKKAFEYPVKALESLPAKYTVAPESLGGPPQKPGQSLGEFIDSQPAPQAFAGHLATGAVAYGPFIAAGKAVGISNLAINALFAGDAAVSSKPYLDAYQSGQMSLGEALQGALVSAGPQFGALLLHAAGPKIGGGIEAVVEKSGVKGGPFRAERLTNIKTGEVFERVVPSSASLEPVPKGFTREVVNVRTKAVADPNNPRVMTDALEAAPTGWQRVEQLKNNIFRKGEPAPEKPIVSYGGDAAPAPSETTPFSGQPTNGTLRNTEMPTQGVPVGEPYSVNVNRAQPPSVIPAGAKPTLSGIVPPARAMKVTAAPVGQVTPAKVGDWAVSSYRPTVVKDNLTSTFASFKPGGHEIWLNISPAGNYIDVGFKRLGSPTEGPMFGRVPGGNAAELVQVGHFLQDLIQQNPKMKILASAYDERLRDVYKRLAFDPANMNYPDSKQLVLNPLRLARLMNRAMRPALEDVVDHVAVDAAQATPSFPQPKGNARQAVRMNRQNLEAVQRVLHRFGAINGQPQRVIDFHGIIPEPFKKLVAGRPYVRELLQILADLHDSNNSHAEQYLGDFAIGGHAAPNWYTGSRFGGLVLGSRNLGESNQGFRKLFEGIPPGERAHLKEFEDNLVYVGLLSHITDVARRHGFTDLASPEAIRHIASSMTGVIPHEVAHNGEIPHGEDAHGPTFVGIYNRLADDTIDERLKARDKVAKALKKAFADKPIWEDLNEWQHHISVGEATARAAQRAVPSAGTGDGGSGIPVGAGGGDSGGQLGAPSPADQQPGGGLAPALAEGAGAAPVGSSEPSALAGTGDSGLPPGSVRAAVGGPMHGPPDPVQELLDAKTTEDAVAASFIQKIIANVDAARTYFSPTERANRAEDARVLGGAKNIVVRYAGDIHQTIPREAGLEARGLRREMGAATPDQLAAMTGALDDVDDNLRARFLALLTPEQVAMTKNLANRIDAIGDLLAAAGIIDEEKRVRNYLPHILNFTNQNQRGGMSQGGGLRRPVPKPRNAIVTGHRTQATLLENIAAGHTLVTKDPFKIYEQYVVEAKTRLAMAGIINDIRHFDPEGVKYLKPGEAIPDGFQVVHHPMFEGAVAINIQGQSRILRYRYAVRDNVAGYVKALAEPSHIRGNKVGRAALTITSSLKRTVLGGPLDINFAGFEAKAAAYLIGSDIRRVLPAALHTMFMGQEGFDHFLGQNVNYAGRNMTRTELYARLDHAGLTSGTYRTEISRMMGDEPTRTLPGMIPVVGNWYEHAQNFAEERQFDRLIPTLKHETAAQLVQHKLRAKYGSGPYTDEQILAAEREAATDTNTGMGGLNRVAQGRSKTAQDLAALFGIAPDWLESRLKVGAGAFMPGAQNATNRRYMARVMIAGAVATVVGSTAYAHERGWDQEQTLKYIGENLNPVRERNGKIMINPHFMEYQMAGTGQWTSLLSWEKDAWKLVFGMYALATGDRQGFDLTAGGYVSARAGVGVRLLTDVIQQRNYSGQPITNKSGWPAVADFLKYEATQSTVPSFASDFLQANVPDYPGGQQSNAGAIQNMTGFGRARTISATDTADRAVQDEHIPLDSTNPGAGEYMHFKDLPNDLKDAFKKKYPDEVKAVEEARVQNGRDTFDKLSAETSAGLAGFAEDFSTDREKYRLEVADFMTKQGAVIDHTIEDLKTQGVTLSDREGDQGLLDKYFAAVKPATDPVTKVTDFDQRDVLDQKFQDSLSPQQKVRLGQMLSFSSDPQYAALKKDKKFLADSGYFKRIQGEFEVWRDWIIANGGDEKERAAASGWKNTDDVKAWVRNEASGAKDLSGNPIPATYWKKHPVWQDLQGALTSQTQTWLEAHPQVDFIANKWAYQTTAHSQEAYDKLIALTP